MFDDIKIVQFFFFLRNRKYHTFFTPYTGDLQAKQTYQGTNGRHHQKSSRQRLVVVVIQYKRSYHYDHCHEDRSAKASVTGQSGSLTCIVCHNTG